MGCLQSVVYLPLDSNKHKKPLFQRPHTTSLHTETYETPHNSQPQQIPQHQQPEQQQKPEQNHHQPRHRKRAHINTNPTNNNTNNTNNTNTDGTNNNDDDSWRILSLNRRQMEVEENEIVCRLRVVDGNGVCADCGAALPTWASVGLGVLVCSVCVGSHRNLGSHITIPKSLHMDNWTSQEISRMEQLGNTAVNSKYEWLLHQHQSSSQLRAVKPVPGADIDHIARFVTSKYEMRCFVEGGSGSLASTESANRNSSSTLGVVNGVNIGVLVLSHIVLRNVNRNGLVMVRISLTSSRQTQTSSPMRVQKRQVSLPAVFTFNVQSTRKQHIIFEIVARNRLVKDAVLGRASYGVVEVANNQEGPHTLAVTKSNGQPSHISIMFDCLYTEFI